MKTILSTMIGLFAYLMMMASAQAAPTPAWNCRLDGNVAGYSVGIGIGVKYLEGQGRINCDSLTGEGSRSIPVMLKFWGGGIALDFTRIRSLHVVTGNIGVAAGPADLIGTYSLGANVGATLLGGTLAVDAAVTAYNASTSFQVGFQAEDAVGLGVRALGRYFSIRPL